MKLVSQKALSPAFSVSHGINVGNTMARKVRRA